MNKADKIQSPLAKARGLGSSHHGTAHWLAHNITTLLNIPLVAWLIYSIYILRNSSHEGFVDYISTPFNMVVAILLIVNILYHFALEIQVVYEDYISCKALRMVKVIGMKLFFVALGLAAILSILKVGL